MSAIVGIYHLNKKKVSCEESTQMMDALSEYPADKTNIWHKNHIFMGCHAQHITEESISEILPFYDAERGLTITADAIIDNRNELFEYLAIEKRNQKEMSDSQLIIHAYCKWGEAALNYLIGDYAFVIWDERKQKLFGARDPSGYRTLYYYHSHTLFAFSTTIEPLLTLTGIKSELNEQWLAEYLAISGMIDTLDARMTPYLKIEQIPPFHLFTLDKSKIKLEKYGFFHPKERLKLRSNQEYIEAFQDVFHKAVNAKLRTFRGVGSQLSGGLDSGSVASFAARELRKGSKNLHTFTYVPTSDFVDYTPSHLIPDERDLVKKTVNYVGGMQDCYYNFMGRNSYSEIDHYLDVMEMPYKFLENSFWLSGMFEQAHNLDLGVLLNGDRGNFTISWGSSTPYFAMLIKKFRWIHFQREFNQYCERTRSSRSRLMPFILKSGFPSLNQLFKKSSSATQSIINPNFATNTKIFSKLKDYHFNRSGWFATQNAYKQRKILFEDILPWNAGNTLDCKLSLHYKLWKRDPTNDLRVVRFCLSLPEDQYVQDGLDRALVRKATKQYLPDSIRLNQSTRGIQAADWIQRMIPVWPAFVNEAKQLCKETRLLEYIDGDTIASFVKQAERGPSQEHARFEYSLLMRCLIVNRFLKKFN
ncbi:asparagine synthase-related protein [Amphibacillus jilinensis]|uniref:asparagine synthase-related protein n=1 Tax=Amphibacillus jilinensis TaxID=1216008 RepID=UPI0002EE5ABA|nr:asparagine synthase-related protein [Amphibacillus jilinensis]